MIKNQYLLTFYRGQRCVFHPSLGSFILDGDSSLGVTVRIKLPDLPNMPERFEYRTFNFDEIKIILKPTSDSLTKRFSDSVRFIKHISDTGCWVGEFGETITKL